MHDQVEQVGGDCTALANALVLVVGVGVAVRVKDFEERSCVDGFNLVDDLLRESHSLEDSEQCLMVEAVECFFPI